MRKVVTTVFAVAMLVALAITSTPSRAQSVGGPTGTVGTTGGIIDDSLGQSSVVQSQAFLTAKDAGRVIRDADTGHAVISDTPLAAPLETSYALLDYDWTKRVIEPEQHSYDDAHTVPQYDDANYLNFCGPGAATVVTSYWLDPFSKTGTFHEPYGPHVSYTYWANSDDGDSSDTGDGYGSNGRSWILYFAEKVLPDGGGWTARGLDNFDNYPTKGNSLSDARDVLNWEVSGHSSTGRTTTIERPIPATCTTYTT